MPQTSDGIVSPDDTDKYKLVPQLAALAETTQLALNKRANYYTGTTAQRTAFTSAAGEGVAWKDTNGTKGLYVKEGTAWNLVYPRPSPVSVRMTSTHSSPLGVGTYDWLGNMSVASNTNLGPFTFSQANGTTYGTHLIANTSGIFEIQAWLRWQTSVGDCYLNFLHNSTDVSRILQRNLGTSTIQGSFRLRLNAGERMGVRQYYSGSPAIPTNGYWTGLVMSYLGN